jgi:hypothetical protein
VFWLLGAWVADRYRSAIRHFLTEDVPAHYLIWGTWRALVIGIFIFLSTPPLLTRR